MTDYPFFFTWTAQHQAKPFELVGGEGAHFTTADGGRWLDLGALSYQVNAGHGHPAIIKAIGTARRERFCMGADSAVPRAAPGRFQRRTAAAMRRIADTGA